MSDLQDFELRREATDPAPYGASSTGRIGTIVGVVMLIAAIGTVVYYRRDWWARPTPAPVTTPAPQAEAKEPAALGGAGEAIALPALDASDALVRSLVQMLSSNPTVASWLATNGLIRNFVLVTANLADGTTPARHLKSLRPSSTF